MFNSVITYGLRLKTVFPHHGSMYDTNLSQIRKNHKWTIFWVYNRFLIVFLDHWTLNSARGLFTATLHSFIKPDCIFLVKYSCPLPICHFNKQTANTYSKKIIKGPPYWPGSTFVGCPFLCDVLYTAEPLREGEKEQTQSWGTSQTGGSGRTF